MVKLYNKNFKRGDIDEVKMGDVIVYPSGVRDDYNYLIVGLVGDDKEAIFGQVATPYGIDVVPLEKLVCG